MPAESSGGVILPSRTRSASRRASRGDRAEALLVGVEHGGDDERVLARDRDADVDARVELELAVAVGAVGAREVAQGERRGLDHEVVERRGGRVAGGDLELLARSSTASSMSTSTVITKSGAVALDSAIRRATVRCSRLSSWWDLAAAGLAVAGGRGPGLLGLLRLLRRLPRPRAPRLGSSSPLPDAASTSDFTIRPPGPVPSTSARSTPDLARHPARDRRGLDAARRRRASLLGARSSGASASSAGFLVGVLVCVLRLVVLGVLVAASSSDSSSLRRRPRCSSESSLSSSSDSLVGRDAAALADLRDRLADRERVALLGHDLERPRLVGLVGHVGLVRLDLDELLALGDLVAVGLEPLEDRALLHGVGQAGHRDVGHGRQATGSVKRKTVPPPSRLVDPDPPAVAFDDLAADREADAGALVGLALVQAAEHLEDLLAILGRDADAAVGDRDLRHPVRRRLGAHPHPRAPVVAELQRVRDQVLQQLLELRAVAHHRRQRRRSRPPRPPRRAPRRASAARRRPPSPARRARARPARCALPASTPAAPRSAPRIRRAPSTA